MKARRVRRLAGWLAAWAVLFGAHAPAQAVELADLVDPQAHFEKIADGFRYVEGPVWDSRGWLLFSDIPANTVYQWRPGPPVAGRDRIALPVPLTGSLSVYLRQSGHSNGLTIGRHGQLIAAQHERRVSRLEPDGSLRVLADHFEGKRLNSPNDIVVKSDGSVYFTDPPYGLPDLKSRQLDFSGIYRISVDGELSVLDKQLPFPNGLAFSPDEKTLYVIESEADEIRAYDVQPDGSISGGRLFATVKLAGSHEGPDGMKVDDRGNVFCAGPDGIWIFAPGGRLLGKLPTPEVPANLAFGGDDRATLYVTARTAVYRIALKTAGHPSASAH